MNKTSNYCLRDILLILIVWSIFLAIPYILSFLDIQQYKIIIVNSWYIYAIILVLTTMYIVYPAETKNFICRILCKKIEETTGLTIENSDETIQKLKEEVKGKSLIFSDNFDDNIVTPIKDTFFEILSKDLFSEKYEKVVLDASTKAEEDSIKGSVKEFKCKTYVEIAYSSMNLNQYDMPERIKNLQYLIESKYNTFTELQIKFLLSLCQCYLVQDDVEAALDTSYKALCLTRSSKINNNTNLLSIIYHIQTRVFIALDKPMQAIATAKEGIKYANDKMDSLLNYLLSSIYFNYLKDPYKAKIYAIKSWSKIYQGAEYYNSLVYLYYFSSFFAGDYQMAVEFLENHIMTENNNQHYGNLSYLLFKIGRISEAKKIAEQEIDKNTDSQKQLAAKNTLAMIMKEEQNYERAIYLFSDILPSFEKDKDNYWGKYFYAEILYNRGVCYTKLKNYAKATDDISKAIELNFDDIDICVYEKIEFNLENKN